MILTLKIVSIIFVFAALISFGKYFVNDMPFGKAILKVLSELDLFLSEKINKYVFFPFRIIYLIFFMLIIPAVYSLGGTGYYAYKIFNEKDVRAISSAETNEAACSLKYQCNSQKTSLK